jgi:3-dehydroquinate dehydratase/shikimate dehydrogenase
MTRLLKEAEESGATIVKGLEMFIGQAYEQYEKYTGLPGKPTLRGVIYYVPWTFWRWFHCPCFSGLYFIWSNGFNLTSYIISLISFCIFSTKRTLQKYYGKLLMRFANPNFYFTDHFFHCIESYDLACNSNPFHTRLL